MANELEKSLSRDLKNAIKHENEINNLLSENDKADINEISSNLDIFLKKNKKKNNTINFINYLNPMKIKFKQISSFAATLVIGIFIGQQIIVYNNVSLNTDLKNNSIQNDNDSFYTKSIYLPSISEISSLSNKLEPGKKIAIDFGDKVLFLFEMSELPIIENGNCYPLKLKIIGTVKSNIVDLKACKNSIDSNKK